MTVPMMYRVRTAWWKGVAAMAAAWVGTGVWVGAARGDQVVLKNGDRLTGHVVALDAGKLTINVLGLGDVKVDVGQVATFATDGPVELKFKDGTAEKRRVFAVPVAGLATTVPATGPATAPATGDVIIDGGLIPAQRTSLADISQVNPPPPPGPVWAASITAGALLIRGNSNTDTLNLGVNVSRKTEQDTVAVVGSYLYGRTRDRVTNVTTTTTENWQVEGRYDYNFTKRFYGFLDFLARKDRIAFLDLRLVPSGGVGYKFINEPDFTLAGEVGLAWVYEKYTNNTPTREDVSGRFAYHVTKKFNDTVSAFHDLEYLQSVQHGGNFNINADLGVRAQLTEHFFGEAKISLDYDARPANGALKTDVFYAVNLGYKI